LNSHLSQHDSFESRVRLEISLRKIVENFKKISRTVQPCTVTAILKANAYGLGVSRVANALAEAGAAGFGVAEINEAIQLKSLGLPIQILGNLLPGEIPPAVEHDIICPVNDLNTAKLINAEAERQGKTAECHFLIDTGMGRLGLLAHTAADEIRQICALPNLRCTGIYSHFPVAYQGEDAYTRHQIDLFKQLLAELRKNDIRFEKIHMANSDAVNNFPESWAKPFNGIRVGLNLYGFFDSEVRHSMELEPVIELKTRLAAVRTLPEGSCIGYGRTYHLIKDTKVGTISAGYADGLPLALSNRGYVLIRGQLCPVLGRVSMDYTTVSLESVPDAECGDEVVCIGTQGGNSIPIDHWSQIKGTHAYDLLCSVGSRVKRVYLKN
jgi:alanine racemase